MSLQYRGNPRHCQAVPPRVTALRQPACGGLTRPEVAAPIHGVFSPSNACHLQPSIFLEVLHGSGKYFTTWECASPARCVVKASRVGHAPHGRHLHRLPVGFSDLSSIGTHPRAVLRRLRRRRFMCGGRVFRLLCSGAHAGSELDFVPGTCETGIPLRSGNFRTRKFRNLAPSLVRPRASTCDPQFFGVLHEIELGEIWLCPGAAGRLRCRICSQRLLR